MRTRALATSQMRSWSFPSLAVTNQWPSGLKARVRTRAACGKILQGSPVVASHNCAVLSHAPEAIHRPSGLKATG